MPVKRRINARRLSSFAARIIVFALLFLAALAFVLTRYKISYFGSAKVEEVVFYLTNGSEGGSSDTFLASAQDNLATLVIVFGLICVPVIDFYRNRILLKIRYHRRKRARTLTVNLSRIPMEAKLTYAVVLLAGSLVYLMSSFGVADYLAAQVRTGTLYEDHYVDPKSVAVTFPAKKRNLVYIYLESMENTLGSKNAGGAADTSYIPELESLALDQHNVSFSNTNQGLGGAISVPGTNWTVAGMAAQSAGVQIKNDFFDRNDMGKFSTFLPGAYSIGDMLQKEGYAQELMIGSDASFGARDKLYTEHGQYTISDYLTAKKNGKIDNNYYVWWGYEDKKLFEYAKESVTQLASGDKPFNFQLLTADTHFVDGYLDPTCATPYARQYLNVYACSSRQVAEFVAWIQAQPFADNTTIVMSGDHIGMQTEFYDQIIGSNASYRRTIYNVIINPAQPVDATRRYDRLFTTMDMYPTTLAAMGVTIPGERLGLGTNLFSDKQTLAEQYGITALTDQLDRRSRYYNEKIFK